MPRDMERFHAYLAKVKNGPEGEIFAPIIAANPMAKPHMLAYADALLALDADRVLADACAEAERRLAKSPLATKVSLTPVDDVGGAWSDRSLVDFEMRFGSKRPKKDYGYVTAVVYASETPAAAMVRERVLAAIYRAAWSARFGYPEKVRDLLAREGIFAGPSSGAILSVAARVAATLDSGTIVALLPDGGWKYLSTGTYSRPLDDMEHELEGGVAWW